MDAPTSRNSTERELSVLKPPYTDESLKEIACILQQSDSQLYIIKSLSLFANLVPLLNACASHSSIGRKLLANIARTDPTLFKHFVRHKLLVDPKPSIRQTCLQSIFDLIDETPQLEEQKTTTISFSELDKRIRQKFTFQLPPESKLDELDQSDDNSEDLEKSKNKVTVDSPSLLEVPIKDRNVEQPPFLDIRLEGRVAFPNIPSSSSSAYVSEDEAPDLLKSKGSLSWFLSAGVMDQPAIGLFGGSASMKNDLLFTVSDSLSDESEELNVLSSSEEKKLEESWLNKCKGTMTFPAGPRRSILKSSTSVSTPKNTPRILDTPCTSFMHKFIGYGVVVVLGDLASLDPDIECRKLATMTLQLLLKRSPDSLIQRLPKYFGHFLSAHRELIPRKVCRPMHLDKATLSIIRKLYGDLNGRNLVVGEGGGDFAEKLMSYFDSHCGQNALELIISVYHNEIKQLRRYPGFADIHHKLFQRSRINFDEEGDCKLFNPVDTSNALSEKIKTKSNCPINSAFLFGVDATKLEEDNRLKNKRFDNVIWNFPQVEHDVADHRLKSANRDLIGNFLKSVTSVLEPYASVRIALHTNVFKHPDTGDEVSDSQFDTWGLQEVINSNFFAIKAIKNVPQNLYRATNVAGEDFNFSKATLYILRKRNELLDPDSDQSYNSTEES